MSSGSGQKGRDVCYLLRWFYVDPSGKHHVRVEWLGSNPEVDQSTTVESPNILAAAADAHQTYTSYLRDTQ